MKNFRLSILTLMAVLALSAMTPPKAQAQAAAPPAPFGLNLTPDEKAEGQARTAKMQQDVQALRDDKSMTDAQKQDKFLKMRAQYQADMIGYLTPAQRKILDARRQQFQTEQQQFVQVNQALRKSLSPAQLAESKSVVSAAQAKLTQIQTDPKLSNDQKQAQAIVVQKDMQAKLNAMLTPPQKAQVKKMGELEDAMRTGK